MRLAIVATPAFLPDHRPAPGALDGDLVRARLSLEDAGFRIVDIDPGRDLAEQLDGLFDEVGAASDAGHEQPAFFLFYASSPVALSGDRELFLCLDSTNPDIGDGLGDIAAVFNDRARGAVLFVIECHHPGDASASAGVLDAAREAVASSRTGIELLVAAHPLESLVAEAPSAFTRAFVAQLDEADPDRGLTAEALFQCVQEDDEAKRAIPCFARARGQGAFPLLITRGSPTPRPLPIPTLHSSLTPTPTPTPHPSSAPPDDAPEEQRYSFPGWAGEDLVLLPPERPSDAAKLAEQSEVGRDESIFPEDAGTTASDAPIEATREAASLFRAQAGFPAPPQAFTGELPAPDDARGAEGDRRSASPAEPPASVRAKGPAIAAIAAIVASEVIEAAKASERAGAQAKAPAPPPPHDPIAEYLAAGDALAAAWDMDGALGAYKKALALIGLSQRDARADVYLRMAYVRWRQDKRSEAIASFEKALQLAPEHRSAIEALIELNLAERDWRGLRTAEERLLTRIESDAERFAHLVQFAERWEVSAEDVERARDMLERAREISPDDVGVLRSLQRLYDVAGLTEETFEVRLRIAELTEEPREQAKAFLALAKVTMQGEARASVSEINREQLGTELLDRALDADPTLLDPLVIIAALLAARQEWGELELAYRRMLDRAQRIADERVRSNVIWELCRRLGLLFRDHLEDPESALAAFEDAVAERPDDLTVRLTTAGLARSAGRIERAIVHLQAVAVLDPGNVPVFHDLFDAFQKTRRPDQAWAAASVALYLGAAEQRERFVFEEHRNDGVLRPACALRPESWELLRAVDRDRALEAVLTPIADAAIRARLTQRAAERKLAQLDPSARQDPQRSTVSVVRSFTWAGQCLGVKAPAVYLREDAALGIVAVMVEEPSVIAGSDVLRGRSMVDLAFLVGSHLAYHVGPHRLLLYFPSIDELSACFLAAVRVVRPAVSVPAALEDAVTALTPMIDARLTQEARDALALAVIELYEAGESPDLAHWAGAVERCAARTGYLLSGDLGVAAASLARAEAPGVLSAEERIGDLLSFTVGDAFHALRQELGVAIQP